MQSGGGAQTPWIHIEYRSNYAMWVPMLILTKYRITVPV